MNELYFVGMDIVEETKTLVDFTTITCTDGMTDNELRAYKLGVENTLSALKAMLSNDGVVAINIPGLDIQTELSIDEVEEYCFKLQ
jgi:hypothetical protein